MALTQDRNVRTKYHRDLQSYKVAEDAVIHKGAIVALDGGYLKPASDTAGLRVVGIAFDSADNAGGSDGDASCRALACVARVKKAAAVTQAHVGADLYVEDDGGAQLGSGDGGAANDVTVGMLRELDGDYAWCEVGLR